MNELSIKCNAAGLDGVIRKIFIALTACAARKCLWFRDIFAMRLNSRLSFLHHRWYEVQSSSTTVD